MPTQTNPEAKGGRVNDFTSDVADVKQAAGEHGIEWDDEIFSACFGKGTYRYLIAAMGISYSDGMDIGLFDLHQNYGREDMEAKE